MKKFLVVLFAIFALSWTAYSLVRIASTTAPDFSLLYYSAKNLLAHKNPYIDSSLFTINAYPPITILFYTLLAFLEYKVALSIFLMLSFLSLIGVIFLSFKLVEGKIDLYKYFLFLSLALISFPVKFTFGMGQINLIAFFILLLSFYFHTKEKEAWSGILLTISIILKPIFCFFIIYYFLRKSYKLIFSSIIAGLIIFSFLLLIFGYQDTIYWISNIIPQLLGISSREVYYNQGIMGFISRLTTDNSIRVIITDIIGLLLLIVGFNFIYKNKDEVVSFSLAIAILILIDNLSLQHHFVWLLFPFILLSDLFIKTKQYFYVILLLFAYFLVSWNFKNSAIFSSFPEVLFLSHAFFGALLIYLLILKPNLKILKPYRKF